MSTEPLLRVHDLEVTFDLQDEQLKAVDGVSFDVRPGRILGIVGESGSGKSVTSRAIMQMIRHPGKVTGGEVRLNGRDLLRLNEKEMLAVRGKEVAMIFQDPQAALNPVMRIKDQVVEALHIHGVDSATAQARALELLEQVGIPNVPEAARKFPHQFSGGMRQRVVIAIALANNPSLLIADEPTTALDVTIQAQILDLLRRLRDELGVAILFITHDMGVVAELCDDVVVMHLGRIVERGPVRKVLTAPEDPYTIGLMDAIPKMDSPLRDDAPEQEHTVLEVRELKTDVNTARPGWFRKPKPFYAVNGVSLEVRAGETLALVGESGCGKSTLSRTVVGINEPAGGEILVNGTAVSARSDEQRRALARTIQYVFQDPYSSLNPRRTAGQSLEEALRIAGVPRADVRDRSVELLERVSLGPQYLDRYPWAFSGGQRQRIGIARALASDPRLLILDEPVSALDVSIQAQILTLLTDLQKTFDLAYLFISHDLAVVREISHRVAVMNHGEIVEQGTTEDVFENPQHPYTRTLLTATPDLDKAIA
ncbi:peptide/nickel transport system ATP-binding protein/glutathione transport system ATP-binding protein [Kribbella sp. VKM Ac-2569]|uniref:ABC transporter ATP-binding protein n=1 Tax=Kribbella sp. VKM Ac-2569 TaxID=2512220 RepID=UPI00102BE93B|nr:ABC transporter ATP-binding protein [Kribbella sp. VKM Ac-2569]RZT27512.1 peptide/nickel transport system ATP-binding protein/glutathione transport system ATP-binding protein [Kribbella sp. VKM Ac-2569]